MASGRPPGGSGSTPTARIGFDYSSLRNAPNVARESGRAVARELEQSLRVVLEKEKQTTVAARTQSSERVAIARTESVEKQQLARRETIAFAEEQRRQTAQFKSELHAREQAQRQSQRPATSGLTSLVGVAGQVGIGLGVAEVGRNVIELTGQAAQAERTRGSYERLAKGVGESADSMLSDMQRASRGLISDSNLVLNANRSMLMGVADSGKEMAQLLEVARVRGQALQISTTDAFKRLVEGIGKREIEILDELGIVIKLIPTYEAYARSIGKTAEQLTEAEKSAAIFKKVIADSAPLVAAAARQGDNAADKFERAATSIDNAKDSLGQFFIAAGGPEAATGFANEIQGLAEHFQGLRRDIDRARKAREEFFNAAGIGPGTGDGGIPAWMRVDLVDLVGAEIQRTLGRNVPLPIADNPNFTSEGSFGGPGPAYRRSANYSNRTIGPAPARFDKDQVAALRRREEGFAQIDRDEATSRLEATRTYERQRSQAIADFEKSRAREAEDFGRQRLYAERKHNLALLDVAQDSARQRSKWEEDSERTIAKARTDTAKQLAELDKDFARDEHRRRKDFRDDQLSAAGRLDAIALLELRKDRARELQDRREAHEEQRSDLQEQLVEREREERDSLQRRIDEQKENDRMRIEEMKAAFEESRIQEDIERGIRLDRQAEDHQGQLDQLDEAHGERLQQIKDHAQAERDQFTEESNTFLEKEGIHNQKWLDEQEKINEGVIRRHEELLAAQRRALLGSYGQAPGFPSLADPYKNVAPVPSTGAMAPVPGSLLAPAQTPTSGWSNRTVNANITIYGDGLNEQQVAEKVVEMLEEMDR